MTDFPTNRLVIPPTTSIDDAAAIAQFVCKHTNAPTEFVFNGKRVVAKPDEFTHQICNNYYLQTTTQ